MNFTCWLFVFIHVQGFSHFLLCMYNGNFHPFPLPVSHNHGFCPRKGESCINTSHTVIFFHLLNWEVIVGRCIHVKLHVYSPSAQFVIISRSSVCLSKVCSAESAASTELSHDCDINMVLKTCVSSCPFVSSSSKAMFLKWGYVYHQGYPEVLQRVL